MTVAYPKVLTRSPVSSPYTRPVVMTRGFRKDEDRARHFYKRGVDFGCVTSEQYERMADEFLGGPLPPGAAECTRSGGALVRYNEATREFGVLADGTLRITVSDEKAERRAEERAGHPGQGPA